MDLKLLEEQEMLKTMARDFLTNKFPKTVIKEIQATEQGYSEALWKEMADLGWQGLIIPEKYGGNGMTFQDLSILLEEMGRACMPGPFFATVILGAYPLLEIGSEDQKQKYLPGIASGKLIFTTAITELDGQYDAASITCQASRKDGDFIIKGSKLFVPYAHVADYIIVVARTENSADPESGISLFLVDTKTPGIEITPLKTLDNEKTCEVVFNNVRVSGENLLGEYNKGWQYVRKIIERAAVSKCCEILGAMQSALEMTVQYAKDRKQFDQPIGKFQIIQHYCANMFTDVEGLKYVTYRAVWLMSEGLPSSREVSIAKAWANEASDRVMALAHQIHGAIGVTIDHDLQYYTKRIKAATLSFGDSRYHREIVATQMGL